MPRVDPATLEHLDEHGYCTVPAVVDEATAAQVRAMMDEFLGPACDHIDVVGRGMQKGTMWPERTAAEGGGPLRRMVPTSVAALDGGSGAAVGVWHTPDSQVNFVEQSIQAPRPTPFGHN